MELIASLPADTPLREVPPFAARAERLGFDVLHVPETAHDPFVNSALALEHTRNLTVRTSMVVAFPRSPMTVAYAAWDLARFSEGRFQLGIASQVRGNIVGRYSATWDDPVSRLKDYVASLRAIFAAFQHGTGLDHSGPHYRFDRLQPYFDPGPLDCAAPSIWIGGVNVRMTELGGEVADGFVCHPTASHPRYLKERVHPILHASAARSGRPQGPLLVINARPLTGRTTTDLAAERERRREELAFLYSTPAYRAQLELFGLEALSERLGAMAREGNWNSLAGVLSDEVLAELLPQGTYGELAGVLDEWYRGHCDGISLSLPEHTDHDRDIMHFIAQAKEIPTASLRTSEDTASD
ncbi:TIGR03617 family F420-dependent LLM class oxidoreductase [Spirillospora sp. NPDC029432]|uniref:TIGR03617 family F420-dependent LLM class oxidoreductase n=1 Tax=Spirillospora sp. NPDC029432 TaxID=3154599 RepID=UPI0034528625